MHKIFRFVSSTRRVFIFMFSFGCRWCRPCLCVYVCMCGQPKMFSFEKPNCFSVAWNARLIPTTVRLKLNGCFNERYGIQCVLRTTLRQWRMEVCNRNTGMVCGMCGRRMRENTERNFIPFVFRLRTARRCWVLCCTERGVCNGERWFVWESDCHTLLLTMGLSFVPFTRSMAVRLITANADDVHSLIASRRAFILQPLNYSLSGICDGNNCRW